MVRRTLQAVVTNDLLTRVGRSSPVEAIEELIWNGLDEGAKTVRVEFEREPEERLGAVTAIRIIDDGAGLSYEGATHAFVKVGDSNKKLRRHVDGQPLHGQRGEGRYKIFRLGRSAEWLFTYADGKALHCHDVRGSSVNRVNFDQSERRVAPRGSRTGCVVSITGITEPLTSLLASEARNHITRRFAPFLLRNPDRQIIYDGRPIRTRDVIRKRKVLKPVQVQFRGEHHRVQIEVLEWKFPGQREILLCDQSGIAFHELPDRGLRTDISFTVFAKGEVFKTLHAENLLPMIDIGQELKTIARPVRTRVSGFLKELRKARAQEMIERLKDEGSYPYSAKPASPVEKIERRVFDVCATHISVHLPTFDNMEKQGRTLLFKLVKEAIATNPSRVQTVLHEVLRLPKEQFNMLASMIESYSLPRIVNAAHLISSRLNFLTVLNGLVYLDPFEKAIYERTQLQKLIAANLWIFGEEYALGTSDQSLRAILERHISIVSRDQLQPQMSPADVATAIKAFNAARKKTPTSLDRVPDFMVWRKYIERRSSEWEFLVIEIKRPGVMITQTEVKQISDYARAVIETPFAERSKTQWTFVVVADELDDETNDRAHTIGLPEYTILRPADKRYEIRAMPWNAIIRSAKSRHEYLSKQLEHEDDFEKALESTGKAYEEILPNKPRSK